MRPRPTKVITLSEPATPGHALIWAHVSGLDRPSIYEKLISIFAPFGGTCHAALSPPKRE